MTFRVTKLDDAPAQDATMHHAQVVVQSPAAASSSSPHAPTSVGVGAPMFPQNVGWLVYVSLPHFYSPVEIEVQTRRQSTDKEETVEKK